MTPYVLYGVKYIDLVSLAPFSGREMLLEDAGETSASGTSTGKGRRGNPAKGLGNGDDGARARVPLLRMLCDPNEPVNRTL